MRWMLKRHKLPSLKAGEMNSYTNINDYVEQNFLDSQTPLTQMQDK